MGNYNPFLPLKGWLLISLIVSPLFVMIIVNFFMTTVGDNIIIFTALYFITNCMLWAFLLKNFSMMSVGVFLFGVCYNFVLCIQFIFFNGIYFCDKLSFYLVDQFSPSLRIVDLEAQIDTLSDILFFCSSSIITLIITCMIFVLYRVYILRYFIR